MCIRDRALILLREFKGHARLWRQVRVALGGGGPPCRSQLAHEQAWRRREVRVVGRRPAPAGVALHVRFGQGLERGAALYTIHAEAPGGRDDALSFATHHPDIGRVESR